MTIALLVNGLMPSGLRVPQRALTLSPAIQIIRWRLFCTDRSIYLCINAKDSMPEGSKLTLKTENVCLKGKSDAVNINLPPREYIRLTIADTGHCIFISEALSYLAN